MNMSLFLDFSLSLPQAFAPTPIKYITSKINHAKKVGKKEIHSDWATVVTGQPPRNHVVSAVPCTSDNITIQ